MSDRTQYFRKFPITIYNDTPSLNIMRRVDFNKNVKNFLSAFYSFETQDGQKPEILAYDYYDDVDLDWLIYLTNDVIDPYYDVALQQDDFDANIKKKYGSAPAAQKKVFLYRNNYRSDDQIITEGAYTALPGERKKYWEPIFNQLGIMGYRRAETEIYAATNKIISYSFTTTANTPFTKGEVVDFTSGSSSGSATVATSNTTYVTLQHITGDWSEMTSNFDVVGDTSNVTINFNYDSYTLIKDVIPASEQVYFSQYSYYDYETDINEKKREIYLVDSDYAQRVNKQLDDLLK